MEISKPHETGSIATGSSPVAPNMPNMFTYYDNRTLGVALHHTQMFVSVDLLIPGTTDAVTLTKTFDMLFWDTFYYSGNSGNSAFAIISDDYSLSSTFTYDGVTYKFNYFDNLTNRPPHSVTLLDIFSENTCKEAGITGNCLGFITETNENSVTNMNFSFSVQVVPEPETYAMLLAGLGLVGFVARRRRNTVRN